MTDLEGANSHELAHLLNGLDGATAPPTMPAPRCGSQTGHSQDSTRASSCISVMSTQFKDAIDEALRAQAKEAEERETRLLEEQARQTWEMVAQAAR